MENLRFVNTSFESTFVNTTQSIDCGTLSQSLYYTHTLSHSINIVLNAVHQRARVRSSIQVCERRSWRQSCCDQTLRYICNHTPHDRCATHVGQPLRPPAAAQCPDAPLAHKRSPPRQIRTSLHLIDVVITKGNAHGVWQCFPRGATNV